MRNMADRIVEMSIPEPNSGCWIWLGGTAGSSPLRRYGRITIGSRADGTHRTTGAHRVSFEAFKAPIPAGMEVCHKCDTACCVNPDHLFVGTKQDNMDDRERKGRNKLAFGENNGQSKLTEQKVIKARLLRANGWTYQRIATLFGVDKKTAMRACKGEQWAWLSAAPTEGR